MLNKGAGATKSYINYDKGFECFDKLSITNKVLPTALSSTIYECIAKVKGE